MKSHNCHRGHGLAEGVVGIVHCQGTKKRHHTKSHCMSRRLGGGE